MADARPPAPDGGGPGRKPRRLRPGDLVQFAVALLASVGVGSLLNRLRKRSNMSDSDPKPQRRVTGSRRSDPPVGPPQSDVEEEKRQHAEEDAQIEAKRAIGHEPSEIGAGPILWIGVGIAVFGVVVSVALWGLFNLFLARPQAMQPQSALGGPQPTPPGPRLQTDPMLDWQVLQATEAANLHTYGWADEKAGVVRIPIERAMDLVAQRGLPVAPGSTRQFGSDRTPNLDSSGGTEPTSAPPGTAPAGEAPTVTPTPGQ